MAYVGSDVVAIRVTTTSSTGSFRDISQQVDQISGFDFEAILQESHGFGDAYVENIFTGLRRINPVTITARFDDDTSTGIQGIFGVSSDVGAERVVKLNLGTTNAYIKFDFIHQKTRKLPGRGALTNVELTWMPTGSFTIVTT